MNSFNINRIVSMRAVLLIAIIAGWPIIASAQESAHQHGGQANSSDSSCCRADSHGSMQHDHSMHQHAGHASALGKPAAIGKESRSLEVNMTDNMRFEPKRIEIKRGETIRFVVRNNGQLKHEFVVGTRRELKEHAAMMVKFPNMEHADPNAISVEPGKTGELAWKFTRAGNFSFACLVPGHFEAGMEGTIVVKK